MMKNVFIVFVLLAVSGIFMPKCFAGDAYDQLQSTERDSEYATRSNTDEGARDNAGLNFDTPSNSAPPVDLSEVENPTPELLRNSDGSNPYTPEKYRSLHTTPPPPLP